jgi:hypothetical protein
MKVKKMWLAVHPREADNYEVSFTEPNEGVMIHTNYHSGEDEWVEFKEYIIMEIET